MFDNDSNSNNPNKDKFAHLKAIAAGEVPTQQPTPWQHEVNNPLIGTIKGFGEFHHERFGLQRTIIVERENGEVVSAFMNAYIANGMEHHNAQPGDLVLIQLLGKAKSQHGNQYNEFQLYVEKPA
ncbi:hypothetical protein JWZ98_02595 [Methylomonas sp. EFPC1]|uniref:hypothetical protein n=1 Tax=Methylomonas sp. EFPC1 TaxID=2812647 RepID=UPI0019682A6F|nr:hypothetical protein [Methylomonas sp. EFPC1]QSB01867.1 hypothetical protein JWZ98_02595 [Methylomonas sp. EFPC1]